MKRPRARTIAALLVAVVAALALPYLRLGGLVAYDRGGEYLHRTRFDAAAWRDSARAFARDPVRIRMVDDLLKRHTLEGRTSGEVVALLGEPDATAYFEEWDMVYWLGPERGLVGIDSEWLVIRLDDRDRVIASRLVTD
jgi:hypothetical protein